jgi:glycosyltransferase involved in cell wall biosynthesis
MTEPALSVVVCTYERAEILRECLAALGAEPLTGRDVELIVVDNNSRDDTWAVAEQALAGLQVARVVHEPQQGLSHARNRGYGEARAPWVAYVDDDALVKPGWVERALRTIATERFDAFGGVYLPWYKYGRPHWFKDAYASNAGIGIDQVQLLGPDQYFSGGNCAFRRAALEDLGGFPTEIGMKGRTRSYGEETLVQIRMRRAGCALGFDPGLVVQHLVSRHKMSLTALLGDRFAAGRDSWRAFACTPTLRARVASVIDVGMAAVRLPGGCVRLLRRDYYPQNLVLDLAGPAAYALGRLTSRGA